jgi:phosphohistidine phosphatase
MKLYLLRHGVAYDREDWQDKDDELRPLTDDGIDDMKREARRLSQIKLKLDAIITSPLVRARDTAWLVAKALDMNVDENPLLKPGFNLEALDILLGQYVKFNRLMIVGHEPDFSQVIAQLVGGGTILVRKGGLARVDISELHPPHGELVWLLTPSLLDA